MLKVMQQQTKIYCTCKLCKTFKKSFIPVRLLIPKKAATHRVGPIAIDRVNRTLFQRVQDILRKPLKSKILLLRYQSVSD